LTEVESILPEETMAVRDWIWPILPATCLNSVPTVCRIWASVPEKHTSMTTVFKHLKPHEAPWGAHMLPSFSVAPTVQAVIIDSEPIVNPKLASII
jgi:hypothetical protein